MTVSASAQVQNTTELYEALKTAKGGDVIELFGTFEGVGLGKLKYPDGQPLILDGKGKAIFTGKPGLSVMDCWNIVICNATVYGGVDLNDSYPEIGLRNVSLIGLTVRGPAARGIFLGAHNANGLFIKNCDVRFFPGGTHDIYMSGGHWDPSWPPVRNVVIQGCIIGVNPAARNGIQFNGRFDGGLIEWNLIHHAQLNGITLIGCRDFIVRNNVSYGHNRGSGVVVYDYSSQWAPYFNFYETQADIDSFRATHWPCQNILIERNTFVVGPKRFSIDPWHSDDPTKSHPGILLNNAVHSGFTINIPDGIEEVAKLDIGNFETPEPDWYPVEQAMESGQYIDIPRPGQEFNYPYKDIVIRDNIIHTPSLNIIDIYNAHEAQETSLIGNMVYSTKPGVPCIGKHSKVKLCIGNFIEDPAFRAPPKYGFVDLGIYPEYDWTKFKTSFDPFSWPGKWKGKGAKVKFDVFWVKGGK
jgi:hypothetical protein